MASVTSSNSIVEARIQWALEQLQTTQPNGETNQMHLPNVSRTRKNPWNIIIRYGQVYSVYLAPQVRDAKIKNTGPLTGVVRRLSQSPEKVTTRRTVWRHWPGLSDKLPKRIIILPSGSTRIPLPPSIGLRSLLSIREWNTVGNLYQTTPDLA